MKKEKVEVPELGHSGLQKVFVCDGVDYGLVYEDGGVRVPYMWVCVASSEKEVESVFVRLCLAVGRSSLYTCLPRYLAVVTGDRFYPVRAYHFLSVLAENDFDWSVGVKSGSREVKYLAEVFDRRVHSISRECFGSFVEMDGSLLEDGRIVLTEESLLWSRWEWDRLVWGSLAVRDESLRARLWLLSLGYLLSGEGSEEYVSPFSGFVLKDSGVLFMDHGVGFDKWASMFCLKAESQFMGGIDRFFFNSGVYETTLYGSYADRSSKGAYYTPAVWVSASQELLGRTLGSSWQEEYYVWDCAAGTGNLLQGLSGARVFASTLEESDVKAMCARVDCGELDIPKDNIFAFDFLNGSWEALPAALRAVVMDPEKRERLVIYMNPPYVGVGGLSSRRKEGVIRGDRSMLKKSEWCRGLSKKGKSVGMLNPYVAFIFRCYTELRGCKVGVFCPLAFVANLLGNRFYERFRASYMGGFVVNSKTFDNVFSEFPIAFMVWDMVHQELGVRDELTVRVYAERDTAGSCFDYTVGVGKWYDSLNDGLRMNRDRFGTVLGYLTVESSFFFEDFMVYVHSNNNKKKEGLAITSRSMFAACVYFAVRHCYKWPWWLSREVYRWSYAWEGDDVFKLDCLWFMQTSLYNCFKADALGVGWYPFGGDTAIRLLASRHYPHVDSFGVDREIQGVVPAIMSAEAQEAMSALHELYAYYEKVSGDCGPTTYYAVRQYFQGVNGTTGIMAVRSGDSRYEELQGAVKAANRVLGGRIFEKVQEYGFLSDEVCMWLDQQKEQ